MKKLSLNKRTISNFSNVSTLSMQATQDIGGAASKFPTACSDACVSNVVCATIPAPSDACGGPISAVDCYTNRCGTIIP